MDFKSMYRRRIVLILALLLWSISLLQAQHSSTQADFFRSTGKIYVVVAVVLVTFIGMVVMLYLIDRRVSRLERNMEEREN